MRAQEKQLQAAKAQTRDTSDKEKGEATVVGALDWRADGHEWIGLRISRRLGVEEVGSGTITKWWPADVSNPEEDPALCGARR